MTAGDLAPSSKSSGASPPWLGCLQLSFARQDDATRLTDRHTQAPLKLQRPFYPEGPGVCHGVMLHTAGGFVGGDRLQVGLTLGEGAHALMTSAAASKVYRSAGEPVSQVIDIEIAPGACLEWFPQETILFSGARYHQQVRVALGAGSVWTGWDIVRLGRSARGETFEAGSWRTTTVVTQNGSPVWIDPQGIDGGSALLSSPTGLRGAPVVGTFVTVGPDMPRSLVEACRQASARSKISSKQSAADETAEFGVTRLMSGLLCRYRGRSTTQAKQWFEQVWTLARQHYCQRPGCRPRVWP